MELVVLFFVTALIIFGPRRGQLVPSPIAMALGAAFLLWMLMVFGMSALWKALFGTLWQP